MLPENTLSCFWETQKTVFEHPDHKFDVETLQSS